MFKSLCKKFLFNTIVITLLLGLLLSIFFVFWGILYLLQISIIFMIVIIPAIGLFCLLFDDDVAGKVGEWLNVMRMWVNED